MNRRSLYISKRWRNIPFGKDKSLPCFHERGAEGLPYEGCCWRARALSYHGSAELLLEQSWRHQDCSLDKAPYYCSCSLNPQPKLTVHRDHLLCRIVHPNPNTAKGKVILVRREKQELSNNPNFFGCLWNPLNFFQLARNIQGRKAGTITWEVHVPCLDWKLTIFRLLFQTQYCFVLSPDLAYVTPSSSLLSPQAGHITWEGKLLVLTPSILKHQNSFLEVLSWTL